jgi:predicted ribosomally synthesized peptide with SipW-like signal peptide
VRRSVLLSLLVIGAAVSLIGGATIAYFSSSETVGVSSTAGTMNLQVSKDNGSTWHDGNTMTWSTPAGWAPGDTATLEVAVRNVGSSGALVLGVGGQNLGGTLGLVDVIHITEIDATEYGYSDWMGAPMSYWKDAGPPGSKMDANDDDVVTLREFVDWPYSAKFFEGLPPLTTDYLDGNGSEAKRFKISFEFDPAAGNEYQGATASFDLKFTITDDPTLLGTG